MAEDGAPTYPARDPVPDLTFPDGPRLELEELLGQLTARAQDVLRAQGRLRALLRANAAVASDLSLRLVLRHIASAARELVDARYAALGVLARDGSLEEFVHVGMDDDVVARVGELPRGRGILGLLISHPEPVRLAELSAHPAAVGFPPDHPPMGSFLGVPIRVRDQVFGNLYLTESIHGEFTREDEQLVVALASSAAIAIENARLYQDSERRRHWQSISTEATQALFADSSERPIEVVLRHATNGAEGDVAFLGLLVDDGVVEIDTAVGELAADLVGQRLRLDEAVTEPVFRSGKPVLIDDYASAHETNAGARIGSVMVVPLQGDGRTEGALAVCRVTGRRPFDQTDLDQLAGFATHAGLALELDRARAGGEKLRLLQDHDRIATDLHDHVIQELFSTGMGLEAMVSGLERPDQRARVLRFVDNLDTVVRRIRTAIYQLKNPASESSGLQQRLMHLLDNEVEALGFRPDVEFSGPLDSAVPAVLADDVVAAVREGVTNVAQHAQAGSARISVVLADRSLTVQVIDDGVGIGDAAWAHGLTTLRHRAAQHGGTLEVTSASSGGCRLCWTASPG